MTTNWHVTDPGSVAPLDRQRLARLVDLLSASFADEPNFVNLFPRPRARARALPRLFTALCRDASSHGRIDEAWQGDRLGGVAVWLAPGAYPLDARRQARLAPTMLRLMLTVPGSASRLARFNRAIGALHPPQPYAYLAAIGVAPGCQGQGVGEQLLVAGLDAADAAGVPAYLEAQRPATVAWYQRHGFEVLAATSLYPGGACNWAMLRPAAT